MWVYKPFFSRKVRTELKIQFSSIWLGEGFCLNTLCVCVFYMYLYQSLQLFEEIPQCSFLCLQLLSCNGADYIVEEEGCRNCKETRTQWAVIVGINFICHCQSQHPFVHSYYFSVTSAECEVVSFLLTEAAFGLRFEWTCGGSPWQLPLTSALTHKRVCRCRLTGCDMDNSLHRSHQHT